MSSAVKTSYLATDTCKGVPKFSIKIEINQIVERETAIESRQIVRSLYAVHDEEDPVLQSTTHTLFLISRELGDRSDTKK